MGGGKHATERGLWNFEDFEVYKGCPWIGNLQIGSKLIIFKVVFRWHQYRKYRNLFAFLNGDKEEEITGMTLLSGTTER